MYVCASCDDVAVELVDLDVVAWCWVYAAGCEAGSFAGLSDSAIDAASAVYGWYVAGSELDTGSSADLIERYVGECSSAVAYSLAVAGALAEGVPDSSCSL